MRCDLNIIQAGAINWVWDRFTDALRARIDGAVMVTPAPMPHADRHVYLCPEYAIMSPPDALKERGTVVVNHLDPQGLRSLEARRGILGQCGGLVVLNQSLQRELDEAGLSSTRIPYGIDFDAFAPHPQIRINGDFVIGVCGKNHGDGRKNPQGIVDVCVTLAQTRTSAHVEFCGYEWEPVAKTINDASGPVTASIYHGSGKYSTYPRFYNGIDALLITSANEGGPYPAMEALACGVPVVSTPVGWVPELAMAGSLVGAVRIYDHGAVMDAVQALNEIATNRPSRDIVRATVSAYTWHAFAAKWAGLLGLKVREDGHA